MAPQIESRREREGFMAVRSPPRVERAKMAVSPTTSEKCSMRPPTFQEMLQLSFNEDLSNRSPCFIRGMEDEDSEVDSQSVFESEGGQNSNFIVLQENNEIGDDDSLSCPSINNSFCDQPRPFRECAAEARGGHSGNSDDLLSQKNSFVSSLSSWNDDDDDENEDENEDCGEDGLVGLGVTTREPVHSVTVSSPPFLPSLASKSPSTGTAPSQSTALTQTPKFSADSPHREEASPSAHSLQSPPPPPSFSPPLTMQGEPMSHKLGAPLRRRASSAEEVLDSCHKRISSGGTAQFSSRQAQLSDTRDDSDKSPSSSPLSSSAGSVPSAAASAPERNSRAVRRGPSTSPAGRPRLPPAYGVNTTTTRTRTARRFVPNQGFISKPTSRRSSLSSGCHRQHMRTGSDPSHINVDKQRNGLQQLEYTEVHAPETLLTLYQSASWSSCASSLSGDQTLNSASAHPLKRGMPPKHQKPPSQGQHSRASSCGSSIGSCTSNSMASSGLCGSFTGSYESVQSHRHPFPPKQIPSSRPTHRRAGTAGPSSTKAFFPPLQRAVLSRQRSVPSFVGRETNRMMPPPPRLMPLSSSSAGSSTYGGGGLVSSFSLPDEVDGSASLSSMASSSCVSRSSYFTCRSSHHIPSQSVRSLEEILDPQDAAAGIRCPPNKSHSRKSSQEVIMPDTPTSICTAKKRNFVAEEIKYVVGKFSPLPLIRRVSATAATVSGTVTSNKTSDGGSSAKGKKSASGSSVTSSVYSNRKVQFQRSRGCLT